MDSRSATAIILGAGFSYVAGLPLAKDLFASDVFIPSEASRRRFSAVLQSLQAWETANPGSGPEQFLTQIYRSDKIRPVPWPWATEFVAAVVAAPPPHYPRAHQTRHARK